MTKKKTKRDEALYPNLQTKFSTKRRRDSIDNRHYVNGVKFKGFTVIPALDDDAKSYLNQFNKEYYGASFDSKYDYDTVHISQIDEDTADDLRSQIRDIKKKRKKIFSKSPNTTTEADRELARHFTAQIEEIEEFFNKVHPRRSCEKANYSRNMDFINYAKASNEYKLVSWEELTDDIIGNIDPEIYIQSFEEDDDDS
jgi:hypothetical protein